MGIESIEIGHAEDGFRTYLHEDTSFQSLVETVYPEYPQYPDPGALDLEITGWEPGVKEWLVLSCVSILAMMDAFDATLTIPLIPGLSTIFERPLGSALWIETSYLLANAASQAFFAMLSEVFGQGPTLIISGVIATVGTGVCSGSMSLASLVAGRLVQGVGSGGAMGVSFLVMSDLIPDPHRVRFFDYICRAWVLGTMFGPVVGGLLDEYTKWTWAFYSSFVFCALALLVIPFAIDLRECKNISMDAVRTMDWLGAALTLLGIGSLLIGISWGGTPPSGWDDWRVLLPVCVGSLAILALVLYESIWASQPMFNLGVFRNIPTVMLYIGGLLHGIGIFSHLQNLPMYLFSVKSFSPALTGLSITAITGPSLPALLLTSKMRISKSPHLSRTVIRAGWILNLLASGCVILLDTSTPPPGWIFIFFATGVSHALLLAGYNTCIHTSTAATPQQKRLYNQPRGGRAGSPAFAIVMFSILRTWGMCIAVPVSGTIVVSQLMQEVPGGVSLGGVSKGLSSAIRLGDVVMPDDERGELSSAYVDSFRVVWRFFMAVSALGGISSLLI